MDKKLGVAVIGCGWVAEEYVKAFINDGRAEVRALVNRTAAKAQAYKDKYALDCAVETDAAKVIPRDDIGIVVVSTSHEAHTEYVVAAAEAGKHVIIEKPVALSMAEVLQQQKAINDANVKSVVSFVLHWNPLLETIDSLIDQNAFGDVFMVEVDYFHRIWGRPEKSWLCTKERGGTSMLAAGCHAVDALRQFSRSKAVEVSAYEIKTANPCEYPGTTTAVVKFENGMVGRTTSCFDAKMPYVFNIGVYGTEGTMRNDQVYAPKLFPGQDGFTRIPCILPDSGDVRHHPFQGEVTHFLDCIIADKPTSLNIDHATETMAMCFAADLSAAECRPVPIAEILGA